MESTFKGKRVLVTGAGKGIGRDIAIALNRRGADTVALSRTQADLDSLKEECPGIDTVTQDLGDWTSTREVVGGLGHFDLLVNNAGVCHMVPFLEFEKEQMDSVMDINFKALFNVSQVVARGMADQGKGGAIVNLSSIGGKKSVVAGLAAYGPSKAAVDSLTRVMALELGQYKIRVNSINPTLTLTEMGEPARYTQDGQMLLARTPLQKFNEVSDVTSVVLFLLSDQAAMINGTTVVVDGGRLCH